MNDLTGKGNLVVDLYPIQGGGGGVKNSWPPIGTKNREGFGGWGPVW